MRGPLLLSLLLVLLAAAPAAPAAAAKRYRIDVPKVLAAPIAEATATTDVPILLPSRYIADSRRLYGSGGGDEMGYAFGLATVKECGGANACSVATFSAERGGTPGSKRTVRLANATTGYYKGLSCGASCSDPVIEWLQEDVLYRIQASAGSKRTERRRMIALADSAIRKGPR